MAGEGGVGTGWYMWMYAYFGRLAGVGCNGRDAWVMPRCPTPREKKGRTEKVGHRKRDWSIIFRCSKVPELTLRTAKGGSLVPCALKTRWRRVGPRRPRQPPRHLSLTE